MSRRSLNDGGRFHIDGEVMKIFRALYIACATLLGFDVRFNRKGEARSGGSERR